MYRYRRAWGAQHCFKMLFYVYFGNINSAVRAKIPVGDVSWGLLGKIGHFRQGRIQGRTNIGSALILCVSSLILSVKSNHTAPL